MPHTVRLFPDLDDTCLQPKYFDAIAAFILKYIVDPAEVPEPEEARTEKLAFSKDPDEEWDEERKASL